MLFILTGVSGTGKTTLLECLRDELPESSYFLADIDQEGVPSGVDEEWRKRQAARWHAEAVSRSPHGSSVVLSGTVLPTDLPRDADLTVRVCLLSATPEAITSRLRSRYSKLASASELERVVGQTVESFIAQTVRDQPGFERCFAQSSFRYSVVDTSSISVGEACGRVLSLIRETA